MKPLLQGLHTGVILHPPPHLKSFSYVQQHNGTFQAPVQFPPFEIVVIVRTHIGVPGCCDFKFEG